MHETKHAVNEMASDRDDSGGPVVPPIYSRLTFMSRPCLIPSSFLLEFILFSFIASTMSLLELQSVCRISSMQTYVNEIRQSAKCYLLQWIGGQSLKLSDVDEESAGNRERVIQYIRSTVSSSLE
jgi:hypothetical protein